MISTTFFILQLKICRGSVICYIRKRSRNLFMVTPLYRSYEVFRPSCIRIWKMLQIRNLNCFYIMAKMYSNEPKINHHSIWIGFGQHLRTLQTSFSLQNLCNGYVCYKSTPQGLKMTVACTDAAQILFKCQGGLF